MEAQKVDKTKIIMYILIAFIFSVGIRMIWVYQFHDMSSFYWNGQLMINTNDGYYFAEGARDALNGFHQPNDTSPINDPTSLLTAFLAKYLPFSFESIILFMPAFLGSLLVIPLVLIGKSLKNIEVGFIAALLASIAWSYYNRTMTGYYDTDMLNIVFPTFVLLYIILAIQTEKFKYLIYLALVETLYIWWYYGGYTLEFAFFGLSLLYILKFDMKNTYLHKMLIIMLFSMNGVDIYIKICMIVALLIFFMNSKSNKNIILGPLFAIGLVLFLFTGAFASILGSIEGYIFRNGVSDVGDIVNLHFYAVIKTVSEASGIKFDFFANRISGNIITFFLSLIGYGWLCYKHRVMLLALPMLGLGFLAYSSGLRFTVYAVPIMALGVAFFIVEVGKIIENREIRYAFLTIATIAVLTPNILHVNDYKMPTVFNSEEVKVIDYLKKHSSREDYVISWWDYGYPLRYYGDLKTLVDGGIHTGDVNFAPSFILTKPQQVAAKMARLEVEYTEARFKDKNQSISNIAKMMKDYGFNDSNDFLLSLQGDVKLPNKTRDIFIYLPFRMMGIYPTVARFSNMDLMNGKMKGDPFLFRATQNQESENEIYLGKYYGIPVILDKKHSLVILGKNKIPLKAAYDVYSDKNGKIITNIQKLHPNGYFVLVYAKSYGAMYLMDLDTFNSTYIQLFLFENYDKNLFEPVVLNLDAKVYKLKK